MLEIFKTKKCIDLMTPISKIFIINGNDNVHQAFKKLIEGRVQSAPLWDPKLKKFIGLVDYLDLVAFTVRIFQETNIDHNWFALLESEERFATQRVSSISDISHKNPFCPIMEDEPLEFALKLLVHKGVHRVPLMSKKEPSRMIAILTQASILRFLAKHPHEFADYAKKTVRELDIGSSPVITVPSDLITIHAFSLMHEKQISGLGIVDAEGRLVGNISARDLKYATADISIFTRLHLPVGEFIKTIRQSVVEDVQPAISVSETSTIEYVIARLVTNKLHRIYVTTIDLKPIRVISLRDILKALMK